MFITDKQTLKRTITRMYVYSDSEELTPSGQNDKKHGYLYKYYVLK